MPIPAHRILNQGSDRSLSELKLTGKGPSPQEKYSGSLSPPLHFMPNSHPLPFHPSSFTSCFPPSSLHLTLIPRHSLLLLPLLHSSDGFRHLPRLSNPRDGIFEFLPTDRDHFVAGFAARHDDAELVGSGAQVVV